MKRISNSKHVIFQLILIAGFTLSSCMRAQSDNSASVEIGNSETSKELETKNSEAIAQDQSEWPSFHGIDRLNKSSETDLLKSWPDGGPELLWTVSGLGEGYASISIADGLVYTSGTDDDQTYVFAYDLEGELVWKKPNGSGWKVEVSWARGYDGSRSTPTYDSGMVYHLSELNLLTAYEAKTGDVVWSRDLMADFDTDMPDYGFTESVLVDGDNLFVKPAGDKGFQVCLNKGNGETIWINNDIPGSYAYNSPVIHDFGGYHQLISASSSCYYGVDTKTGKLLWKFDFENQFQVNCSDAVVFNEYVFMSSGEGGGCALIKLNSSGGDITAEKIWQTDIMDNYHGGVIYHDGYVYGWFGRQQEGLVFDRPAYRKANVEIFRQYGISNLCRWDVISV